MDKNAAILLCASLMTGNVLAASEPKQVEWLSYSRSAPGIEAAQFASESKPPLGAAHQLSLATSLGETLTPEQRFDLTQYGPWLTADSLSNNAQQLIRQIQEARLHGLNPEAYELAQILRTVDALSLLDKQDTHADRLAVSVHLPGTGNLRESFSQLMDTAFTRIITHLGQGVVDARATQRKLYRNVPVVDAPGLLAQVSDGLISVNEAIESVAPQQLDYKRLQQRMRDLLTERATGVKRSRVHPTGNVNADELGMDIIALKHRLQETGEIPARRYVDSAFDQTLVDALGRFQERHGLPVSGSLTRATRNAINHDVDNEITALALSLERWRWMPRELGRKYVFVNIPDYRVEVHDGNDMLLSMVSVVGSVDHQTPAFSREMSYMEFNPTWTVPAKIANAELIPIERRRPGYLASRQFIYLERVNNRLVQVPSEEVTRADFNSPFFPYILQQKGGPVNALGRIKFMLPNPYAIYLHDTQAKKHFTLNDRAFSHGCVRLSDPDRLATLLMRQDGYEQSAISEALSSNKTKRVRLHQPIPTHITYLTTWVDKENKLHRRADVYEHDSALTISLQASNTLLTTLLDSDDNLITATLANRKLRQ